MKTLIAVFALATLLGCRSYERGTPGAMEQGTIWSSAPDSQQKDSGDDGQDTEHNATRRDLGGSFGGSGGTAPGGGRGGPH